MRNLFIIGLFAISAGATAKSGKPDYNDQAARLYYAVASLEVENKRSDVNPTRLEQLRGEARTLLTEIESTLAKKAPGMIKRSNSAIEKSIERESQPDAVHAKVILARDKEDIGDRDALQNLALPDKKNEAEILARIRYVKPQTKIEQKDKSGFAPELTCLKALSQANGGDFERGSLKFEGFDFADPKDSGSMAMSFMKFQGESGFAVFHEKNFHFISFAESKKQGCYYLQGSAWGGPQVEGVKVELDDVKGDYNFLGYGVSSGRTGFYSINDPTNSTHICKVPAREPGSLAKESLEKLVVGAIGEQKDMYQRDVGTLLNDAMTSIKFNTRGDHNDYPMPRRPRPSNYIAALKTCADADSPEIKKAARSEMTKFSPESDSGAEPKAVEAEVKVIH